MRGGGTRRGSEAVNVVFRLRFRGVRIRETASGHSAQPMAKRKLTHLDESGAARMVDVGHKRSPTGKRSPRDM